MRKRTRRFRIGGIALVSATALLAGCSGGGATGSSDEATTLSGQVLWTDFGGPTNEARQDIFFDPFAEETGVEVVSMSYNDAMVEAMMVGEAGDYDAILVGLDQVYLGKEHLLQVPEEFQDDELPEDIREYAFGTFMFGQAQGYLTETFPDGGPETWADFWDVEKYPGKRAWPGVPASFDYSCESALLADGVAPEDLYPLDFERCGEKLDELRPHMVFYTEYPQVQSLIDSQSVAVATGPVGQFVGLQDAGVDMTISWNEAFVAPNVMAIPKGAPNPENVLALTETFSDLERQARFSERTNYGPGNSAVYDYISEETRKNLVTAPAYKDTVLIDSKWRGENREEYLNFFTDWLAK